MGAKIFIQFLLLLAPLGHALSASVCDIHSRSGTVCKVSVADLRPTQLCIGAIEVEQRSEAFADMSSSKLKKYLAERRLQIVVGPGGALYITDHHHLSLAMAQAFGHDIELEAEVQENWADLPSAEFWKQMSGHSYLYLYDEHGAGPQPLSDLPASIFELRDDPYRSLAWAVSNKGGYEKTDVSHADFLWANFFRSRISVDEIDSDFKKAVKKGVKLAESKDAKDLPGAK